MIATHRKKRVFLLFLALEGLVSFSFAVYEFQQTDPFYLKLFEKAQKSFLAKNYTEAARGFEIAAFGLAQDATLQAKAYFYAGLSHHYLKDPLKTESFLRQGAELLGDRRLAGLEIPASVLPDLEKLLAFYDIQRILPAPPADALPPQDQDEQLKAPESPEGAGQKEQPSGATERAGVDQKEAAGNAPIITVDKIKEGDIVALEMVHTLPVAIRRVAAAYPPAASGAKITGTVTIKALISEEGNVIDTEIIQGIKGAYGFNQAAQQAVRRWKFEPATIKGIKVKVWLPISIVFKRQD